MLCRNPNVAQFVDKPTKWVCKMLLNCINQMVHVRKVIAHSCRHKRSHEISHRQIQISIRFIHFNPKNNDSDHFVFSSLPFERDVCWCNWDFALVVLHHFKSPSQPQIRTVYSFSVWMKFIFTCFKKEKTYRTIPLISRVSGRKKKRRHVCECARASNEV